MTIEMIVSAIAVLVTVIGNIAVMAYFAGTLNSNQVHQKEMLELLQQEFKENFERIEKKQDKHNNLIERTYKMESDLELLHEKIDVANHRISDLETGLEKLIK